MPKPAHYLTKPPNSMLRDVRVYDERHACWIAEQYAGEARSEKGKLLSLRQLHEADPANIPGPLVIQRWMRESVRFRVAMREAERARARELVEECIDIADDTKRTAAQARNAIDARFRLAEAFDRETFAPSAKQTAFPGDDDGQTKPQGVEELEGVEDDELVAIIEAARTRKALAAPDPNPLAQGGGEGARVENAGASRSG